MVPQGVTGAFTPAVFTTPRPSSILRHRLLSGGAGELHQRRAAVWRLELLRALSLSENGDLWSFTKGEAQITSELLICIQSFSGAWENFSEALRAPQSLSGLLRSSQCFARSFSEALRTSQITSGSQSSSELWWLLINTLLSSQI